MVLFPGNRQLHSPITSPKRQETERTFIRPPLTATRDLISHGVSSSKQKGKRTVCHGQDLVKLRILAVSFTLQGINHVGQMISTIACAGRSVNDGLGVARGSCGRLGGVVLDRRERIRLCAYDVLVVAPGVESELLTPQSADSCTFARLSARLLRTQKRDAPATYRHDESVCCARRACQLLRLDRLRTARPRAGWRLR